jgi:hypothetical protein
MTYREIHPQFKETFGYFSDIPDLIQESLWNYIAYGLPPGSFMEAVLKNDFIAAMSRADSNWSGRSLKDLARWIDKYMPYYLRCSEESMKNWARRTDEERRDIMIEIGLRPGEFDILAGRAVT